jgi:death-on-curing protein
MSESGMKEPHWLDRSVILAIQGELLARFGGLEGIRDEGLLDSALGRAQQGFYYGQPDLFDLAATYAHGLVKNHPFLDGNKRIGFMAAYTFLAANGQQLQAPEEEAVLETLALAAGECAVDEYAAWLRRSCTPR